MSVRFQYAINKMRISEDSKTQPNRTLLSSFKALYIINSDFRLCWVLVTSLPISLFRNPIKALLKSLPHLFARVRSQLSIDLKFCPNIIFEFLSLSIGEQ